VGKQLPEQNQMEDQTRDESSPYASTIFQQPWWLDAVAPGHWGEAVVNEGSRVLARMPYVVKKRFGLTAITMPPLTQTLGPWLSPSAGNYTNTLAREKDLMQGLITRLPKFDLFVQNFFFQITNWLPFYWAGFQQTTRYTYRLEKLSDLDEIWNGLRHNVRTYIRKAESSVVVRTDLGIDRFLKVNAKSFERQGRTLPYSEDLVHRLDEACDRNNCRRIFFAEDSQGRIHAAIYLVWDNQIAYYLMAGGDPSLRNSGANSLLIWKAIQFAATVTQSFDFEGSMIEPIERHIRDYGGRQVGYFSIRKMSPRMTVLNAARDSWNLMRWK
jgi:hypothetical protein